MNCNCNCEAYDFPHRPGGGACQTPVFIDLVSEYGYTADLKTAGLGMAGFDCPFEAAHEFLVNGGV
jgi:hypothetical protein